MYPRRRPGGQGRIRSFIGKYFPILALCQSLLSGQDEGPAARGRLISPSSCWTGTTTNRSQKQGCIPRERQTVRGERLTGGGRGSGKTTWRRWRLWGDLSGERRRLPSSGKDETTGAPGSKLAAGCRLCPKKTHFTERETKTQRTQVTSPELRSASAGFKPKSLAPGPTHRTTRPVASGRFQGARLAPLLTPARGSKLRSCVHGKPKVALGTTSLTPSPEPRVPHHCWPPSLGTWGRHPGGSVNDDAPNHVGVGIGRCVSHLSESPRLSPPCVALRLEAHGTVQVDVACTSPSPGGHSEVTAVSDRYTAS